jgi:mono/diheme cytochrome c family protein
MIRKIAFVAGGLLGVLILGALGVYLWAGHECSAHLARHYQTHHVDFPIPFPLSPSEIAALRVERAAKMAPPAAAAPAGTEPATPAPDPLAGVDLQAIALERAIANGKHLVESRFACVECHGRNFGGGKMIDSPAIGRILGVNLTSGRGGQIASYKASDWDRIVRHGVLPDGRPAAMPSRDYFGMSDHELSDVAAYIRSVPPVDNDVPRPTTGPVGKLLIATGKLPLAADMLPDHQAPHAVEPPPSAVTVEFGKHLVQVCTGCHRENLSGGPIAGGDPAWPPALNLTPHADGIAGWTYDDFVTALREGKRKSGVALRPPMSAMKSYASHLTETELKAMWAYLQTVPPVPTPQ